jgi:hypothetical protein
LDFDIDNTCFEVWYLRAKMLIYSKVAKLSVVTDKVRGIDVPTTGVRAIENVSAHYSWKTDTYSFVVPSGRSSCPVVDVTMFSNPKLNIAPGTTNASRVRPT